MIIHVINSFSGSGGAEQGRVREITRFESEIEQHVMQLYAPVYAPDQLAPQVVSTGIIHSTLGLDSSHSGWNWLIGHVRLRKVIRDFPTRCSSFKPVQCEPRRSSCLPS